MTILLETKNLTIEYKSIVSGNKQYLRAVDNLNLKLLEGEIYALAGESGCGKTSVAKCISKLITPTNGEIIFENKNILEHNKSEKKNYPKQVQMIFQNPYSSLNPKMRIKEILKEPLDISTNFEPHEKEKIILDNYSLPL